MRVLLRDRKSNLFWAGEGRWTADVLAAQDFGSSTRCIQHAISSRLSGVEVVLSFENPLYDIALPFSSPAADQVSPPQ